MKPIDFHPDAAQEANDAVDYYDGKQAGLGEDFRAELGAALRRIRHNPQGFGVESQSIRICRLRRFPFGVYYEELEDRIWVAAVGHLSRRPGYWMQRRPSGLRRP